MTDDLLYPIAEDVLAVHADIVASDHVTEPGVRTPEAVSSALTYVSEGYFGQVPGRIHEKAAHLMRLLTVDHPFVDGNKRTALVTVDVFYAANGYVFDYDDGVRAILKAFATDESAVPMDRVVEYCCEHATEEPEASEE